MGKIEKTFWWICFILAVYTTIGFKLIPVILKDQLIKNLDENLTYKSTIEKIEFNPYSLNTKIYNYKLGDENTTIAKFDKLTLDLGLVRSITDLHANVQEFSLKGLILNVEENAQGEFNVAKLVKEKPQEEEKVEEQSNSDIKFLVSKLFIEDSTINFTKEIKDKEPYKISLNNINYKLRDVGTYNNSLASNDLQLKINDLTTLTIFGAFRIEPFKMYGKVDLNDLKIKELLDYDMSSFNFELNKEANINAQLDYLINLEDGTTTVILGSQVLNLNNLNLLQNKKSIASLEKLNIGKFDFNLANQNITLKDTTITNLNATMINDKAGINFANLVKSTQTPTKQEVEVKVENQTQKEESKPWIINLANTNISGTNFAFNDLTNNFNLNVKNMNTKLSGLDINGSNIVLNQFNTTLPTFDFIDKKNQMNIALKSTDLDFDKFDIAGSKINSSAINLKNKNLSFKDKKSNLDINTNSNNIKVKNLNIADSKISIDNTTTNLSNVVFNELTSKLNIKSNALNLSTNNLKIDGSKVAMSNINLTTPNLDLKDTQNGLDVKVAKTDIALNGFDLNGSKIALNSLTLGTPSVNVNDNKNGLDVKVSRTDVNLNGFNLDGSKIAINTIKLSKPDITFKDTKNKLNIDTKDLEINLNKLNLNGENLNINSIRLVEPNLEFLDGNSNTKIVTKHIDLSVSDISNNSKLFKIDRTVLTKPEISVILPKTVENQKTTTQTVKNETTNNSTATTPSKKVDIGPVNIKEAKLNFEDKNLPIPFKTTVSKLNGNISEFKNTKASTTKLEVNGIVDNYGTTKITGIVNPNSIKVLTDINMIFKNIAMSNFTPYSGKFIGRKVDSGKLDLDLKYNIQKSDLEAQNNITITKLKLGDKVESKDAVSLPLELAIALLEDSKGVIDLNLPVSGNVDDPKFSVGPVVWKAFVNLIVKAATAPFSLLGAVFGFEANEIDSVDFEYAQSDITPTQKETLDKITKILTKRENLAIIIQPTYNKSKDLFAMKKEKFEKYVDSEITDKNNKDFEEDYLDLLEDLYDDYDQDEDALKAKNTENDVLNINTYKAALEEYIINQQKVDDTQLVTIARNRVENIKKYLIEEKAINPKQITIQNDLISTDKNSKLLNLELKIKEIK